MPKVKILGLTIAVLFSLATVVPLSTFATSDSQSRASEFIDIAQSGLDQAVKLRDEAVASGFNATFVNGLIADGDALLKEARVAFENGDFGASIEKAHNAQAEFRDALKAIDTSAGDGNGEDKGKGILEAASRAEDIIERLRDVVEGINVTTDNELYINWVNANLSLAANNLAAVVTVLNTNPANISLSVQLLATANKNIEDAFKAIQQIGYWSVGWRADSFLNAIRKDLEKTREDLANAEKKGIAVGDLKTKLTEAEAKIDNARTKLLSGDKQNAQTEVKDARSILHDVTKELAKRNKQVSK